MREFIEETETMYFSGDLRTARLTPERVQAQLPLLASLFDKTLRGHPDWWCQRAMKRTGEPRDWKTFFIEFEYRDVTDLNREWERDNGRRFRKRRELVWVPADTLCGIFEHSPGRLWKRVRQLENAKDTIQEISSCMTGR